MPAVDKHIDAFMGRLLTLLNTGGIILSSNARTADLREVVKSTLGPFLGDPNSPRISIEGPAILLHERTAGSLALALHELATNAVKYGSLSTEDGKVFLRWALAPKPEGDLLTIEWRESDGPEVSSPNADGFGALVIRQSVAREPGGRVTLDYQPGGLHCRFEFEVKRSREDR